MALKMECATDMPSPARVLTHEPTYARTQPPTHRAGSPAEMGPEEFQAWLADPQQRPMAQGLVEGLQKLLAAYSGLMEGKRGPLGAHRSAHSVLVPPAVCLCLLVSAARACSCTGGGPTFACALRLSLLPAVRLDAPGRSLEITNVAGNLSAEQLAAFQRRATSGIQL